jgi:hypothetical protein
MQPKIDRNIMNDDIEEMSKFSYDNIENSTVTPKIIEEVEKNLIQNQFAIKYGRMSERIYQNLSRT